MDFSLLPFFDAATFSWSYLIVNPGSGCCAVVDPVLGYDPQTGEVSTAGADAIAEVVEANGYCVEWILETHVHADHLSAARYLARHFVCAQVAIGAHVRDVQAHFAGELGLDIGTDGSQFDRLLDDGERIRLGHACGRVLYTPGHTGACVSYLFDRFAFVGDTVFAPDYGTARCDFPGGDAATLYRSVQRLYALPGPTRLLLCHDYGPGGRTYRFSTSVSEQRQSNCMLRADTTMQDFVAARRRRDRDLAQPTLFEQALRANLAGGLLPESERFPCGHSEVAPQRTSAPAEPSSSVDSRALTP